MSFLEKLILKSTKKKLKKLDLRIANLEATVDCFLDNPQFKLTETVGFNGQINRKKIFQDLLLAFPFEVIIETGTWVGNTTGYMATISKLPVYTSELNKRFYTLAKMRLSEFSNIYFELSDSREFLKKLAKTDLSGKEAFFYLDAHWHNDLPLEREIQIISENWKHSVIMIDDFQVPGDPGYGFDSYGKGKELSIKTFSSIFSQFGWTPLFPTLPSSQETGKKRGCVVLVPKKGASQVQSTIPGLAPL